MGEELEEPARSPKNFSIDMLGSVTRQVVSVCNSRKVRCHAERPTRRGYSLARGVMRTSPARFQPAELVRVRETGLMWANMLWAFQVGKALTSGEGPSSWMRPSRVA